MTYPYIGKGTESGSIVLFYERGQGVTLKSKSWASEDLEFHTQIDEDYFKNITADYLRNTKVKIESGEHRGFIQKMINGSDLYTIRNGDVLYIMSQPRDKNTCKEITLPLPPKESEEDIKPTEVKAIAAMRTVIDLGYTYHGGELWKPPLGDVKYSHEQFLNQCSDNADSARKALWSDYINKRKEWPQVGDDVLTKSSQPAIVRGFHGCNVWIEYQGNAKSEGYNTVSISTLKKPPTPEEELADILTEITGYQNRQAVLSGAKAIINGEIKGLSYKPE